MFLSVLTKNLNCGSLTKNLVTFNFNIMGVNIWGGGGVEEVREKPIYRGELPKKTGWTVCRFKEGRWGLAKKKGCFLPHFGR